MLHMWCSSPNCFLLIFGISLNFTFTIIYKRLRVFKVHLEEDFKFVPRQKTREPIFVLILLKVNWFPKKWGCKKCLIGAGCSKNIKVILTLLITFHVSFPMIQVHRSQAFNGLVQGFSNYIPQFWWIESMRKFMICYKASFAIWPKAVVTKVGIFGAPITKITRVLKAFEVGRSIARKVEILLLSVRENSFA